MTDFRPENPLVVQSDRSVLVEIASPRYPAVRDRLARFAELEKSPEHVHTYRISPLSLWNAAASGMQAQGVIATLVEFGKYDLPESVRREIIEQISRYGRLKLREHSAGLMLEAEDMPLMTEVMNHKSIAPLLGPRIDRFCVQVPTAQRGMLKQALIKLGHPVEDLAGYVEGDRLDVEMRQRIRSTGEAFELRRYQAEAVEIFHAGGAAQGGSGVIVLPCGAGKTVVGLATIAALQTHTLILCPSTVAARQWIEELHDKTDIPPDAVGEYSGDTKAIRPITVSTYQTLTYRPRKNAAMPHMSLFNERDWGLLIYDEVHLLPAPVFRATAGIQARRRLGLTATLVREDGRADEVFSLIGPKKYDVPWKDLESKGWIATAECTEIRVTMAEDLRMRHAMAEAREKHGLAATNPAKIDLVAALLERHAQDRVLIIGQYIEQLRAIADRFDLPLVTGRTSTAERERRFEALRSGSEGCLVVSKVANFSIDLPDVNVAIQVSGTFGSRQEEAQRLGRILRPKSDGRQAHFYSIVTRDSSDQGFAARRQLFLTEQGYAYRILYEHELLEPV